MVSLKYHFNPQPDKQKGRLKKKKEKQKKKKENMVPELAWVSHPTLQKGLL